MNHKELIIITLKKLKTYLWHLPTGDLGQLSPALKLACFLRLIKLTKHDQNQNYYSVVCIYRPVVAASENG